MRFLELYISTLNSSALLGIVYLDHYPENPLSFWERVRVRVFSSFCWCR
jgi:hypothetical protein